MHRTQLFQLVWGNAVSFFVLLPFVVWIEVSNSHLHEFAREDGPIEYASAVFFLLSSIGFVIAAARSRFLKEHDCRFSYFFIASWAILMLVFFGEEISWGQRIFGFGTPEGLSEINKQHEFNVHNIAIVDEFMGGKHRYLSIMMLVTGLLLPLYAQFDAGKNLVRRFAFPVTPGGYCLLFVGAYAYDKHYHPLGMVPNDASEVRELLMSIAMFLFAGHGAWQPCALFRVCGMSSRGSGTGTAANVR